MGDTEDCLLLPCPHGHVTLEADDCCPTLPAWSLDMMGLALWIFVDRLVS